MMRKLMDMKLTNFIRLCFILSLFLSGSILISLMIPHSMIIPYSVATFGLFLVMMGVLNS